MKVIFLIILGLNTLIFADFTKSGGIVTDSTTSLQWQDDYSDNGNSIKNATWTAAIDYCETLSLGGYTDWKLPNKKELLSIVDYSRDSSPAVSSNFQNTSLFSYWSSTTNARDTSIVWIVYFYSGSTHSSTKTDINDVRCVRAGQ